MVLTGIGMDRRRSLSFARYSSEYVLKTLPKVPRSMAISPITAK